MGIYNFRDGDYMIKRILYLNASDIGDMTKLKRLQSIKADRKTCRCEFIAGRLASVENVDKYNKQGGY